MRSRWSKDTNVDHRFVVAPRRAAPAIHALHAGAGANSMRRMEEVAFFAGAIGALGGAVAVIALRNPFYSVLALVIHLVSLAGLFLLLNAEFIAAAQIVVYAGAVMVLYVFVAAYIGNVDEPIWEPIPGQRILAPLLGLALFIELSIAILGTSLKALESEGPTIQLGFGSPGQIGEVLLEQFLVAFEGASLLLLIAAIGAIVLAGRRPGSEPAGSIKLATVAADPTSPTPDDAPSGDRSFGDGSSGSETGPIPTSDLHERSIAEKIAPDLDEADRERTEGADRGSSTGGLGRTKGPLERRRDDDIGEQGERE